MEKFDKPETIETRHRLWAEGNARIAQWFESTAFKKEQLELDRAKRHKERQLATLFKRKGQMAGFRKSDHSQKTPPRISPDAEVIPESVLMDLATGEDSE